MSRANAPIPLETLAADLALAVGQLLRRLRSQGHTGGLNLSQLATLARLEQSGWMTAADLARAEAMKPQSMGAILSGLEQENLVRRRPDPGDGRRVLFALTARGAEVRKERSAAKRQWLAIALAELDAPELRTLLAAASLIKRLGES